MYGCASWTIKKAERRRTDAFELWCWRRLLTVPWTARRANQSILKEISPEYSWCWSWNSNTLATWVKNWLTGQEPDAGKDWRWEEKGTTEDEMVGWHHRLNGHGFGWTRGVGDGQGGLECCGSWGRKELDTTEQLTWTEDITPNRSLITKSSLDPRVCSYFLSHQSFNKFLNWLSELLSTQIVKRYPANF